MPTMPTKTAKDVEEEIVVPTSKTSSCSLWRLCHVDDVPFFRSKGIEPRSRPLSQAAPAGSLVAASSTTAVLLSLSFHIEDLGSDNGRSLLKEFVPFLEDKSGAWI